MNQNQNDVMAQAKNLVNGMTIHQLQELQTTLSLRMLEVRRENHDKAMEQIREISKNVNMPLAEIIGYKPSKDTSDKRAARYVHPVDKSLTWSGLGRQPNWVKDFLAAGRSLFEFQINAA